MDRSQPIQFFVIMPVYNVEPYIEQSIRSVLAQTYDNFHLIMVDDGSLDNSGHICDTFANQDARLTTIHQSNRGQMASRIAGLQKAKKIATFSENSFVVFLDSDDWLEPNALETISHHLLLTNCDCLIYGFQRILHGRTVFRTANEESEELISLRDAYRKICMDSTYNSLCRKAIRLSLIPETDYSPYYHIRLGEDLLQTLDILKHAKTIAFISNHLYNYRMNSNSMTESINYEKFDYEYTVIQAALRFMRENEVHTEESWPLQWLRYGKRVYADITKLLFSNYSKKDKQKYLTKMRQSTYISEKLLPNVQYSQFPIKERFILYCFAKRAYGLLLLYYQLANRRNKSKNSR